MFVASRALLIGSLATAVIGVTACQSQAAANRQPHAGDTTAATVDGVQDVVLTVNSQFRFTPSTVTVHPGKVRITLKYSGTEGPPHDWQLQMFPSDYVPQVQAGQTRSTTFVAPAPGRYTFECTIHVKQGQFGTLVVLPN